MDLKVETFGHYTELPHPENLREYLEEGDRDAVEQVGGEAAVEGATRGPKSGLPHFDVNCHCTIPLTTFRSVRSD